jgi:hypothetical protein
MMVSMPAFFKKKKKPASPACNSSATELCVRVK